MPPYEKIIELLEKHGELPLEAIYHEFSCSNSKDSNQSKKQDAIRQALYYLRKKGRVTRDLRGNYRVPGPAIKGARRVKADDVTFFDDGTPILAHNVGLELKKERRKKGAPVHSLFDRVVKEGWEVKTKGNHAQRFTKFSDRCRVRFQVYSNGTVRIFTNFKEGVGKGFDYPEWIRYLEFLLDWCTNYGVDFKHFKLVSGDLNQDRRIIYTGKEKNVRVFQGVFLRVYSIQQGHTRFELKLKADSGANKSPGIITEILDPSGAVPHLTEKEMTEILGNETSRQHYADQAKEFKEEVSKISKKQKTAVEVAFYQGKKINTLKDELLGLARQQNQILEMQKQAVEYLQNATQQDPAGLKNVAGALDAVTENLKAVSKRLSVIEGLAGAAPATPGSPSYQPIGATNITATDPWIASMAGEYATSKSTPVTSYEDLYGTFTSGVRAPKAPPKHVVPVGITTRSPRKRRGRKPSKQLPRILTALKTAGKPLSKDTIRLKARIPKNSIRMQLERLLERKLIELLPNGNYQLKKGANSP